MDYNQFSCETDRKPTGAGACVSDLSVIAKIFLAKEGFSFATITDAQTESKWDDAIKAGDLIPFPLVFSTENSDEDTVYDTGSAGKQHKIREGKSVNTYNHITTLCVHKNLRSYDGFKGGYFAVDENENILGTSSDGVKFEPITIDTLSVNKMSASDGSNARYTPVHIIDSNPAEFNDRGASFKVSWNIKRKEGLKPVSLGIVSASATEIIVNALVSCDGTPVSGLDVADFILETGQTISGAVESATILGQYTLSGTGLVSGTLNLAAPSVLSINGFQSEGSVTVTIA